MRSRSMQSLTDAVKVRHPGVVVYGVGDDDHKLRYSDHNEDDTAGSLAAQSDADSTPEHRAIDLMLGPAFTRAQAYALIADLLADPAALARLKYIIFDGWIWSRSNGWQKVAFTGDDHDDHIHISGLASDDENAAGWPAVENGGDMTISDEDLKRIAGAVWSAAFGPVGARESAGQRLADAADESDTPAVDVDEEALATALATPLVDAIVTGLDGRLRQIVREELDKTRLAGG